MSEDLAGRYRLQRKIGQGGMGTVWEALDLQLKRTVAVKLLHTELAVSETALGRFQREARILARLTHPGSVHIYELGTARDGALFIAMELLEGWSAADALEHFGHFTVERAVRICCEALDCLHEAHQLGVIHRDLKPSNLFLADKREEKVKLLDFGIAWVAPSPGESRLTATGMAFGTPVYMAPEMCVGKPCDVRADLYSMACTLYELLSGSPPFGFGSSAEVMAAHLYRVPQSLMKSRPELKLPRALDGALLRGLAKTPMHRFESAAQMREILLSSLEEEAPLERGLAKKSRGTAVARELTLPQPSRPIAVTDPSIETALGAMGLRAQPFAAGDDPRQFAALVLGDLAAAGAIASMADAPPVLLCGPADDGVRMARAIEAGVFDYVPMPLEAAELQKKIARALRRRK